MTSPSSNADRRLRYELAAARLRRALRGAASAETKAGYREDQLRTPAGNGADSGRWTRTGAALGAAANAARTAIRAGALGQPLRQIERAVEATVAPLADGAKATGKAVGQTVSEITEPLRRAPEALDAAIVASPPPVRAFLEENRPALIRAAGVLQMAGGAGEGAAGMSLLTGGLATAPEGGLLATGAAAWMVGQGYDDFSTGLKTLISGEAHETGFVSALRGFGFSADEADGLAIVTAGITPAAALRLGRRELEDAVEHALLRDALEPFGPALRLTKNDSFWTEPDIMKRGLAWEAADAAITGFVHLPAGFKTFDLQGGNGKIAVSNKILDFEQESYKVVSPQRVRNRLKKMVDDVADWRPEKSNRTLPPSFNPQERRIHLLVPSGRPSPGQASQLAAARAYARSRGVILRISHGR